MTELERKFRHNLWREAKAIAQLDLQAIEDTLPVSITEATGAILRDYQPKGEYHE